MDGRSIRDKKNNESIFIYAPHITLTLIPLAKTNHVAKSYNNGVEKYIPPPLKRKTTMFHGKGLEHITKGQQRIQQEQEGAVYLRVITPKQSYRF